MTFPVTAALAGLFLALSVFCGWRGARPSQPHKAPRLIPWRFLMLAAFAVMVTMLVHIVGLLREPGGAGT